MPVFNIIQRIGMTIKIKEEKEEEQKNEPIREFKMTI